MIWRLITGANCASQDGHVLLLSGYKIQSSHTVHMVRRFVFSTGLYPAPNVTHHTNQAISPRPTHSAEQSHGLRCVESVHRDGPKPQSSQHRGAVIHHLADRYPTAPNDDELAAVPPADVRRHNQPTCPQSDHHAEPPPRSHGSPYQSGLPKRQIP